jgi:two-component system nitrate/nitrite response regulator NarL
VSAYLDSEIVFAAVESGTRGYLSKEATRQQICDAVSAVARGETVLAAEIHGGLAREIQLRSTDDGRVLTPREQEVLRLTAEGVSAPGIGERLDHREDVPASPLRRARRVRPRSRGGRG